MDLSKDIDESLFDEIIDAFVKKQVLVFRDQHIEPQHQVAFSRRFGPFEMLYDEDQRVPGFPEKSKENLPFPARRTWLAGDSLANVGAYGLLARTA